MSQTKMLEVVAPAYLEKFSCLGAACPDDCCHGWAVGVDHDTYVRLKGLPDRELKPVIMHALQRGAGKSGSGDYGFLAKQDDERGNCELLNAEGLCRLQQKCGEQMLPDVCSTFPRLTKSLGGQLEQFASPACPEIARLLLSDDDALLLQLSQQPVRQQMIGKGRPEMEWTASRQVRDFFLTVLATAELPAWQSLAVLLLLAEVLQPLFNDDGADETQVAAVLADWERQLLDGSLLQELGALRRHDLLHVKVLAAASRVRADLDFRNPRYLQLIEEALQGLVNGVGEEGDAGIARQFAATGNIETIDAMLRRVLFNHAASALFPWTRRLLGEVQIMCIEYLTLRFWLAGLMQARGRSLREDEIIELIYLFYRVNIHMPTYLEQCSQAFQQAGMNKVEHWLLLLPLHAD